MHCCNKTFYSPLPLESGWRRGPLLRLRHKTKKSRPLEVSSRDVVVRLIGLEPTRRETLDPKSSASTNFATGAILRCKGNDFLGVGQIFCRLFHAFLACARIILWCRLPHKKHSQSHRHCCWPALFTIILMSAFQHVLLRQQLSGVLNKRVSSPS